MVASGTAFQGALVRRRQVKHSLTLQQSDNNERYYARSSENGKLIKVQTKHLGRSQIFRQNLGKLNKLFKADRLSSCLNRDAHLSESGFQFRQRPICLQQF